MYCFWIGQRIRFFGKELYFADTIDYRNQIFYTPLHIFRSNLISQDCSVAIHLIVGGVLKTRFFRSFRRLFLLLFHSLDEIQILKTLLHIYGTTPIICQ